MKAERIYQAKDVIVHYVIHNDENVQTVVLIHGFGVDGHMWNRQLRALKDFKVIVVDVRGHGLSKPCSNFSVILAAQDILGILDQEGCMAVSLVGLSMGSYVAQEFARLYPDRLEGLFLADGTPIFMKYPRWEKIALKYSTSLLKLFSWHKLKKVMSKQTAISPEVQSELYEMFSHMTREAFMISWGGMTDVLHEEDFDVNCPFYFVYGEKDKAGTISSHVKDWLVLYPKCKVHQIINAGHLSNMDNPDRFNSILLSFLEDVKRNYVDENR